MKTRSEARRETSGARALFPACSATSDNVSSARLLILSVRFFTLRKFRQLRFILLSNRPPVSSRRFLLKLIRKLLRFQILRSLRSGNRKRIRRFFQRKIGQFPFGKRSRQNKRIQLIARKIGRAHV